MADLRAHTPPIRLHSYLCNRGKMTKDPKIEEVSEEPGTNRPASLRGPSPGNAISSDFFH